MTRALNGLIPAIRAPTWHLLNWGKGCVSPPLALPVFFFLFFTHTYAHTHTRVVLKISSATFMHVPVVFSEVILVRVLTPAISFRKRL